MYPKTLLVLALATVSSASELKARQFNPTNVPTSIQNVLATAIPPASLPALVDPSGAASIASAFLAGQTPNWYPGLPQSVKDFLNSEIAGASTATSAANSIASSVVASATTKASSELASVSSVVASASSATAASHTSTSNPASRPTGALMAAGAGVVGVVALAVGL